MSEEPSIRPIEGDEIRARLTECAALLRETPHLDAESQRALADLVTELSEALHPEAGTDHATHLAETSAQLIKALHEQHDPGLIASARSRLEQAAARAEAKAPVATGVARQLIDALSSIGV